MVVRSRLAELKRRLCRSTTYTGTGSQADKVGQKVRVCVAVMTDSPRSEILEDSRGAVVQREGEGVQA